ncbi:MAG: hypothetical protein CV087_23270 [Candidatus Brocadia sp. WS118]|nr:MAG: hypothetical protein CV087_23270 [Candidatus Brocadia sp. WS118]
MAKATYKGYQKLQYFFLTRNGIYKSRNARDWKSFKSRELLPSPDFLSKSKKLADDYFKIKSKRLKKNSPLNF